MQMKIQLRALDEKRAIHAKDANRVATASAHLSPVLILSRLGIFAKLAQRLLEPCPEALSQNAVHLREAVCPHHLCGNPPHCRGCHRLLDGPDVDHGPLVRSGLAFGDDAVIEALGVSRLEVGKPASDAVSWLIVKQLG